jgi:hypothetical protein
VQESGEAGATTQRSDGAENENGAEEEEEEEEAGAPATESAQEGIEYSLAG